MLALNVACRRPRRGLFNGGLWLTLGGLALPGCGGTEPTDPVNYVRVDPAMVSGAARTALGADGRFNFAEPLLREPGGLSRPEVLSFARAEVRFLTRSVGNARQAIEDAFGGRIDFSSLEICPRRVIPALTNFDDPSVAAGLRTAIGPTDLVHFCTDQGVPAVEIWVYLRTQARVGPTGDLEFPSSGGPYVAYFGIRPREVVDLSPEFGARLVFDQLKIPFSGEPELDGCLILLTICEGFNGWHWRHELERPIRVRLERSATTIETRYVYTQAGFGALDQSQLYVASPSQPPPTWTQYTVAEPGQPDRPDSVLVSVTRPLRLERFTLLP